VGSAQDAIFQGQVLELEGLKHGFVSAICRHFCFCCPGTG
jgi:hypothetical protein